jgi:uncharacterized protein
VSVDSALLEILRCPDVHHAVLDYDAAAQTLTCTECRRVFPIRDGIPVLLLDEAPRPGEAAPVADPAAAAPATEPAPPEPAAPPAGAATAPDAPTPEETA